jgi:hypothetical protein
VGKDSAAAPSAIAVMIMISTVNNWHWQGRTGGRLGLGSGLNHHHDDASDFKLD